MLVQAKNESYFADTGMDALYAAARHVASSLRREGYETMFAGGCVRDRLLNRPVKDIDIATGAPPDVVERLFPRTVAVGKAFGVVRVVERGYIFEVATFRSDIGIADGRHPAAVCYAGPAEDAARRDFTINALFEDPETGRVLDYVGGLPDLKSGIIRAIGEPGLRFREDRLRLLRAVRFASTLEFVIEPQTASAISHAAPEVNQVSAERRGDELTRILVEAPRAGEALQMLYDTGLLAVVLPEVAAMRGVGQPPRFHPEGDVFTHTVMMMDALPPPPRDPVLAFATMLHDVGKPPTATGPVAGLEDNRRFPGHAAVGAETARTILRRLKRPACLVKTVSEMTRRHMTMVDLPSMRPARRRRFMGEAFFDLECELLRLDSLCSNGDLGLYRKVKALLAELVNEPVLPPPWIKGRDLLALGLAPGPGIGRRLRRAYNAQLEGRAAGREELLEQLRREIGAGR